jgi:hypothetical protein
MPVASAAPEVGRHGRKLELECTRAGVPPFVRGSRQNRRQPWSFARVPPTKMIPAPPMCRQNRRRCPESFFVRTVGVPRRMAGLPQERSEKHDLHAAAEEGPTRIRRRLALPDFRRDGAGGDPCRDSPDRSKLVNRDRAAGTFLFRARRVDRRRLQTAASVQR